MQTSLNPNRISTEYRQMTATLGMGLLSIGRSWGVRETTPPVEQDANKLLREAVSLGIRFFDTAPAYGDSEARLGTFLKSGHSAGAPYEMTIATKIGEHWAPDDKSTYVDHSFEAMTKSLAQSLDRLGKIDLLQIHKASPVVLAAPATERLVQSAQEQGIGSFGASVSDLETAETAVECPWIDWIQIPFNSKYPDMEPVFDMAMRRGIRVLINRPLAMGALADENAHDPVTAAFRFIKQQDFDGVVLTGTRSLEHLRSNVAAFSAA
jgi:aryl-alcohol dehydrogenase-like predicted oxidoreductase